MIIRMTTDPITLRDVTDIEDHPCIYEGDGENGVEIYFESEETGQDYVSLAPHDPKVLAGNDSEDYVAEG
jgi:hypothetical protein